MNAEEMPPLRGSLSAVSPPPATTCADVALTAMVVAIAYVSHAGGTTGASVRMQTLVHCRQSGLLATRTRRDVLAEFQSYLHRFGSDSRAARRIMVSAMTRLVGSDWAHAVVQAAEQTARTERGLSESAAQALGALRAALALPRR